MKYELRPYQKDIASKASECIKKYKICYIAAKVRTGKTLMALECARLLGKRNVLFITKKKGISSIQDDYTNFGYTFNITITNKESIHKVNGIFDFIILDEAHQFGAFPKPGKYTKIVKQLFHNHEILYLSGTPCPESYSQIYHQFWISDYSPFIWYKNFYRWADDFVEKSVIYTSYGTANDYSKAKYDMIMSKIKHLMFSFTQEEAGFKTTIQENIEKVPMKEYTYTLINKLIKDRVIEGKAGIVVADTSVSLQSKLHQLYSGTIKTQDGDTVIVDDSKAQYILKRFSGYKIGIFYKFIAEREMLQNVLGDKFTESLEEFNENKEKWICLQFVAGREAISLKEADFLVFMNIDFSCTSYEQARDRMSTLTRVNNTIYWIFSEGGIEEKILRVVRNKMDYSNAIFKKDFGIGH